MMNRWKDFQAERRASASRTNAELAHARDAAIVCDLSEYELLRFEGEDAETFLHSQLSSDVRSLPKDLCQLATYNSPKGRVLATLMLWRDGSGFLAQLPAATADSIRQRLSMYILRSKVRIGDASEKFACIGVGGPHAERTLLRAGVALSARDFGVIRQQRVSDGERSLNIQYAMRLPGARYQLLFDDDDSAIAMFNALQVHGATPSGFTPWRWLTLRSGIAEIAPETQDQFVAQMLNYELIGAISFNKGCYPGQEVVARAQYRGSIRRRTLLAHAGGAVEPAPGMAIFTHSGDEQAIGTVLNVANSPQGGYDLLMCVHVELAAGTLHLARSDGPHLELVPMPYPIALPT